MPCGSYQGKPRIRREWFAIIEKYRHCSTFNALPKAGGVNDQDWVEMRLFMAIRRAENGAEDDANSKAIRKLGPLGVLMSLPQLSRRR